MMTTKAELERLRKENWAKRNNAYPTPGGYWEQYVHMELEGQRRREVAAQEKRLEASGKEVKDNFDGKADKVWTRTVFNQQHKVWTKTVFNQQSNPATANDNRQQTDEKQPAQSSDKAKAALQEMCENKQTICAQQKQTQNPSMG